MERRQFINLFLTSVGTSVAGSLPLQLMAEEPTRIAAALERSQLKAPVKICLQCESILEKFDDYEALFMKRELKDGEMIEAVMKVKVRHDPLSVYMLFGKPSEGREVIYVEGKNEGKLLVHETGLKGLAGTLSLDPHGSLALKQNHHPIVKFGMKNMVSGLAELWMKETHDDEVEVKYYPKAKVGEVACKAVEVIHPKQIPGVEFHKTLLYLDAATNVPVRLQHYKFPKKSGGEPVLYEEYTYMDFKPNQSFSDIDFSVENPDYNF